MRPLLPGEEEAAGRVTAAAYREFARDGGSGWPAYLERIADIGGRPPGSLVLVALDGDGIAGSATVELDRDGGAAAHIRMLGVDPSRRRRGIGRALVTACIDSARGAGREAVTLHTAEPMAAARRLYESLGFERLADREVEGMRLLSYRLPLRA